MKVKNKRHVLILTLFLLVMTEAFSYSRYVSEGWRSDVFFILNPIFEGIDDNDRLWLSSAIPSRLSSNLELFTSMAPASNEKLSGIFEIQEKVDAGSCEPRQAVIEAGNLCNATLGILITATKTDNAVYQLKIQMINTTTWQEEATAFVTDLEKVTDLPDVAIDKATMQIIEQLNVSLSEVGLYELGALTDLSLNDKLRLETEELNYCQEQIVSLAGHIESVSRNKFWSKETIASEIKDSSEEKFLFEQKLKIARNNVLRLQWLAQNGMEDTAPEHNQTTLTAEDYIIILECRKAAYMQTLQWLTDVKASCQNQAQQDYDLSYTDPDDPANYPPGYCRNGVFDEKYRQKLIAHNEQLNDAIFSNMAKTMLNATQSANEKLETLLQQIRSDVAFLSNTTFTMSSADFPEMLTIHDGNVADVSLELFHQLFTIGKRTLPSSDLILQVEFTIEPDDDEHPSHYFIKPERYALVQKNDGTEVTSKEIRSTTYEMTYSPLTDVSSANQTIIVNKMREEEKMQNAWLQAEGMEAGTELPWSQLRLGEGFAVWAAGTWTTGAGEGFGFDTGLELSFAKAKFSWCWVGVHSLPTAEEETLLSLDFGFSRILHFNLLGKRNYWLYGFQIGPAFYTPYSYASSDNQTIQGLPFNKEKSVALSLSLNTGFLTPLSPRTAFKLQYTTQLLVINKTPYWYDRVSAGMVFYLWEGKEKE